jgi:hypothetical protein
VELDVNFDEETCEDTCDLGQPNSLHENRPKRQAAIFGFVKLDLTLTMSDGSTSHSHSDNEHEPHHPIVVLVQILPCEKVIFGPSSTTVPSLHSV